jgi:hypothetical protein
MYASEAKQQDQNRKAERQSKQQSNYQYFAKQAEQAANDSNRAYGFRIGAKAGR